MLLILGYHFENHWSRFLETGTYNQGANSTVGYVQIVWKKFEKKEEDTKSTVCESEAQLCFSLGGESAVNSLVKCGVWRLPRKRDESPGLQYHLPLS